MVLRITVVSEWGMSADLQRCLLFGLILLLVVSGCSTADKRAANFSKAQELRKNALTAAGHGDIASALDYINQVQVLELRASRLPLAGPSMMGPRYRAIAPAAGSTTCIGINRFYCL